jgi:hypothetical protein
MNLRQWSWSLLGGSACLAALAVAPGMPRGGEVRADDKPNPPAAPATDPAVERAREQVKMLDDLYKNAVVSIVCVRRTTSPASNPPRRPDHVRDAAIGDGPVDAIL